MKKLLLTVVILLGIQNALNAAEVAINSTADDTAVDKTTSISHEAYAKSTNYLHWADIAKSRFSTQIILDFEQVPYIRKKLNQETQQLRISFPGMQLSHFDPKQVLSKFNQLKELGIAKKIELFEKNKKYPKIVLIITFAKTRTIQHADNTTEIVKNSILIKWCKMENPNRLIIDFFTKEALTELRKRDSIFLHAHNDAIITDTETIPHLAQQVQQQRIIIDPGHGAQNNGAVAFGFMEKNLALTIAKKVQNTLKKNGYTVLLTRNKDQDLSLAERSEFAQQLKATLFIALHLNSGGREDSPACGIETYYLNANGLLPPTRQGGFIFVNLEKDLELSASVDKFLETNTNKSQQLAKNIQSNLLQILHDNNYPTVNRGVKPDYFRILLFNQIPTILVEVGFITNKTEANLLSSSDYQELLAQGICNGVQEFLHD